MSTKPSEVYERLKDLRRQGDGTKIRSRISQQLEEVLRLRGLVRKLERPDSFVARTEPQANLIRALEIKTLADRIFGDEQKAEAWLQRPNASLSGQTPADLLNDELGTAVVREMLERIDHGIFA
ncbi:MAG: DUF2384 domain-containing protein [Bradyrhizobium sp.]|nr:DUF2384 domain-containing protein [Bradyrhizobium sp.]